MRRLKPGKLSTTVRVEGFHGEERDQADHGADFQGRTLSVRQRQDVVEESVFGVPQFDILAAEIVHRFADVNEMLEELAGDIFVGGIVLGEFQRDRQHVETIHAHPAGAVGLLDMSAGGQRLAAVEDADIVEAEKAALENVAPSRRLCG